MTRRRVLQSDGRWTQGYRKTLKRRSPVAPLHQRNDWTLSFELPGLLGLGLSEHPMIGVRAPGPVGHIEIAGKSRMWVLARAIEFLRKFVAEGINVTARLQRAAEVGPSGKPDEMVVGLQVPRRGSALIEGQGTRVLVP